MSLYRRLIICFFLSGATGLIYEVAWVRILAQSYGQTVYAVGVVLTAFMTGLSLGSYFFGKHMDRCKNPLAFYAAMEGGIAFFALLSILLLRKGPLLYIEMLSTASHVWAPFEYQLFVKYALTILMLLPATFLMGGTLPVLSKILIRSDSELEGKLGSIYSINTLGGAFGTLIAGFVLIHYAGLNATILTGVALNASISIYVYHLSRKAAGKLFEQDWQLPEAGPSSMPKENISTFVLLGLLLSGCTAMMYEVAWNRLLVSVIGSTTYSLSLILVGVLLGIGLGSMAVSYISKRKTLGLGHFAAIQLFLGATCFMPIVMFSYLPAAMQMSMKASEGNFVVLSLFKFLIVLSLVLAPMLLFGSSFPIIGAIYRRGFVSRGRDVGSLYAINTAGAIIGTVVASFWLLPKLGATETIKGAAIINVLTGVLALLAVNRRKLALAAIAFIAIPLLPHNIPTHIMDTGVAVYGHIDNFTTVMSGNKILFMDEGINANISVTAYQSGNITLQTNGKVDASISIDMPTQLALGYIPMLLHPEPRDALVIGLGIGVTMSAIADFPGVRRIDCVEIEPAVIDAAEFFSTANRNVLSDPRVSLTIEDARKHMLISGRKYDVIISEPSNPWISGIGNLFTREFYDVSLSRLREEGIFVQWMHMYGIEPEDLKMIFATMGKVFPRLSVWQVGTSDLLILGGRGPVDEIDLNLVGKRLLAYRGGVMQAYLGIKKPIDLAGFFVLNTEAIKKITRESMVITDDRPEIEFHAPISMYQKNKSIENSSLLRAAFTPPVIKGYGASQNTNAEFYYLKARNNISIGIKDMFWLNKALDLEPDNPYYLALGGKHYYSNKDFKTSRKFIDQALKVAPGNPAANFEMGLLLGRSEGKHEEALEYFERAVSAEPDNFNYQAEIGYYYLQLSRPKEALSHFLKASSLPHPIMTAMLLSNDIGITYLKLGEIELAERNFKQPLSMNPYYMKSLRNLIMLYLNTGNQLDACYIMDWALEVAVKRDRDQIEQLKNQNCI